MPSRKRAPTLSVERALWDAGHDVVVGVDEVGRGAWAGPLTVGAAVLPRDKRVYKVRDSKRLSENDRSSALSRATKPSRPLPCETESLIVMNSVCSCGSKP